MTKLIDFDTEFMKYAAGWLALHSGITPEEAEKSYNRIMDDWLNAPSPSIGGKTPAHYFDNISDPEELVQLVKRYDKAKIGIPEILYSRVVSLREACVPALHRLLTSLLSSETLRTSVMGMLIDIASEKTAPVCASIILAQDEPVELREMATEFLIQHGKDSLPLLLDNYEKANDDTRLLILEIGSHYPGDERLLRYALDMITTHPEQTSVCAAYIASIGDASALPVLTRLLSSPEIRYLDYIELRNAIDSLGGELPEERDFSGDPDYESLKYMS